MLRFIVVSCPAKRRGAALTFYAFPPSHGRKIRMANGLERLHGEIKRRTKAVGESGYSK